MTNLKMEITKIYDSQIENNNKPLFPTSDVMYFPTFVSEGSNVNYVLKAKAKKDFYNLSVVLTFRIKVRKQVCLLFC